MNHVLHSKPQSHTIAWKFSLPSQSRYQTRFDIKKAKYHWFLCLVSWHTNLWKGRNVMKGKIYHKQLACLFHAHIILPSFMIPLWCFLVIFGAFSIILLYSLQYLLITIKVFIHILNYLFFYMFSFNFFCLTISNCFSTYDLVYWTFYISV